MLDYYGNDSRPVAESQDALRLLRLQQRAGKLAILRGEIERDKGQRLGGASVRVVSRSNGEQFTATTDAKGRYEFQLLPADVYDIKVDPFGSFRPDPFAMGLEPGSCWSLTIPPGVWGGISGHVRYADGSPASDAEVLFINADYSMWDTVDVNEDGSYAKRDMDPGAYVIAVSLPDAKPLKLASKSNVNRGDITIPTPALYYPGVQTRSQARTIKVSTHVERKGIDFILPRHK